ncbi:MAG: serine/threonine-protein kinase, partial [Syntrophaceticus schinkii]|nr:serine/threonine-protein kinase [Syntrophaceticus schinkii]
MLKKNQKLNSVSGLEYSIVKKIGEGGQGVVYEVNQGKEAFALKWYFEHMATESQKSIIENLITKREPSKNFLWPKDLVQLGNTFGYIMPLRPPHYKSIVDMMKRRAEPSFRALCLAGVNLAGGYQELHSMGYSYRDISFGNVFFNPVNGDVLICDNDNVSVNGVDDSGVSGTPRFMAPEIVTGEKKPSTDTDLFSMAVLLFYMFMLNHPLEGKKEANIKCLDINAMNQLYGKSPIFIWDPNDKSNR